MLTPTVPDDIAAALGTGSIPVHGPFHHKGPALALHRQGDFVAVVAIAGMIEVLHDHGHHVHGVAAMPNHRDGERVERADRIG